MTEPAATSISAEATGSDPETTSDRILDVAERLFAEQGFAGTAVRDIARGAGLTAPSLYNHFSGKQALYEAVLARGVQPLADLMCGLGEREEREPQELLNSIVDHFANHPDIAKLIQHESLIGGASLAPIGQVWLRPIVQEAMNAMRSDPRSIWNEDEQPFAIAAWLHMIIGHFAMAPLLRELFDFDPLDAAQVDRLKKFLQHYARLVVSSEEGKD